MNVPDILWGEDYHTSVYTRVKVVGITKKTTPGYIRAKTYFLVRVLDPETGEVDESKEKRQLQSGDFILPWDEYKERYEKKKREREEQEMRNAYFNALVSRLREANVLPEHTQVKYNYSTFTIQTTDMDAATALVDTLTGEQIKHE